MEKECIFKVALEKTIDRVYTPHNLIIKELKEEIQNKQYGALRFSLNKQSVRFRVAKITPTKTGQFVAFWEKGIEGKNQAYHYNDATDLLVITCFGPQGQWGQFVFTKDILLKHKILRTDEHKGKMGIRVYPSWDRPESDTAKKTQLWQQEYFVNLNKGSHTSIKKLYQLCLKDDTEERTYLT